jgi:hypothetical protein
MLGDREDLRLLPDDEAALGEEEGIENVGERRFGNAGSVGRDKGGSAGSAGSGGSGGGDAMAGSAPVHRK